MKRRAFFQALGLAGLAPFIAKGEASWEDDWEDEEPHLWGFGEPEYVPPVCSTRFYSLFKRAIWRDVRVLEGPYYVQLVGPGYEFDINHSTTADITDRILGPKSLDVSVVELDEGIAVEVENGLVFPFPPGYDGVIQSAILSKSYGDLAMCIAINHYMVSAGRSRGDTMTLAWERPLILIS